MSGSELELPRSKVFLMDGPSSGKDNANNHLCRRQRFPHCDQNTGSLKRIHDEGENSRCSPSRICPTAREDGVEKAETAAATEHLPIVVELPAPSWRARDPRDLVHGTVSLLGRRRDMEDVTMTVTGLAAGAYAYFAVFDGHGGTMVARACRDKLHVAVADEVEQRMAVGQEDGAELWKRALVEGFAKVDAEVLAEARELKLETVGSTAVVALVAEKWIMVANCGDSRAVLSRSGVAIAMSRDHKPDRPDELRRVKALGGEVLFWGCPRVFGVLSTSRSLGDYILKPYVSSDPEFITVERSEEDEFLILASDGIWDVISSDMACRVIRRCLEGLASHNDLSGVTSCAAEEAASLLARFAICRGSFDNVTVVVVVF